MLSTLAPARRRLVLTGLAAVLAAVVVVAAILVQRAARTRFTPAAQDQPGPVLLVPGYGGSTGGLTRLAAALAAGGRDARVVSLPDGGVGDLNAAALGRAADAALAQTGRPSVDVIGYSAGGVTARLWIRDYGGAAHARRVITLGSPQHGTDLAALGGAVPGGCPVACRQLAPDSALLSALNSGDETPRGPLFVSVWSSVDEVVVPPDSARLAGAVNIIAQDVCSASTVAHGNLPTDPLITAIVLAELGGPGPTALTAADCQQLSS